MAVPLSQRVWLSLGSHVSVATVLWTCRTLVWPEPTQVRWELFVSSATTLQFLWTTNPFLLCAGSQHSGQKPTAGVEVGSLKSEQWDIPDSMCMFLVGGLCELFWGLASELLFCHFGNRSRRGWESFTCLKHRGGVVHACGIQTKQSCTSEARQESLRMCREEQEEAASF